jgi:alpha-beta hydrolase superfamily lysophospholipase
MRKTVRVDVTDAVGTGETLHAAATVSVPDEVPIGPAVVLFGFPGGACNRHYYDLQIAGHVGYSQAEHHVGRGEIFVACDHLGVGDSDVPASALDFEAVARANAHLATEVLSRLRDGTLVNELGPVDVAASIALGHSYGAFLLIIGQAHDPVFDGVGILGFSARQTTPSWPEGTRLRDLLALKLGNGLDHPMLPMVHYDDVPEDIVVQDMTKVPGTMASSADWGTPHMPGGPGLTTTKHPLMPGVVAEEAAAISVPVFVGCSQIDLVPDPWSEPAAYRGSADVTVTVVPRMAHLHNFASTRHQLWDRIGRWAHTVARLG